MLGQAIIVWCYSSLKGLKVQVPVAKQTSKLSSLQMQRVSSKDLTKNGSRDLGTKLSGKEPLG